MDIPGFESKPCVRACRPRRALANLSKRVSALRRNQRGVTALEFALVAPIFLIFFVMTIEVGFMLLADGTLDRAASDIARQGRAGHFQTSSSCVDDIRQELDKDLSFWADRTGLQAEVTGVYEPQHTTPVLDADGGRVQCNGTGDADRGDLVLVRLSFNKPGMTGVFHLLGLDLFRYERVVAIQNDP